MLYLQAGCRVPQTATSQIGLLVQQLTGLIAAWPSPPQVQMLALHPKVGSPLTLAIASWNALQNKPSRKSFVRGKPQHLDVHISMTPCRTSQTARWGRWSGSLTHDRMLWGKAYHPSTIVFHCKSKASQVHNAWRLVNFREWHCRIFHVIKLVRSTTHGPWKALGNSQQHRAHEHLSASPISHCRE